MTDQGWKIVGLRHAPDDNGRFALVDIVFINWLSGFSLKDALAHAAQSVPPDCEYVAVMRG